MNDFTQKLLMMAGAASNNKYLASIRDAFTDYMPFTIIGAIGTLWTYVIMDTTSGLASLVPAVASLAFLNPLFNALNFATIGCITLGVTFAIGAQIGKRNGQNTLYCGLMAVAALLIVTSSTVDPAGAYLIAADGTVGMLPDGLPEGATAIIQGIAAGDLGTSGMFTGMIVGIISVELLNWLSKFEGLKIKLPDAVPPNIAGSFNALIPSTLCLLIVGGVALALQTISGGLYLNQLVYSLIQVPLQNVGGSFAGGLVFVLLVSVFWCFGLHGNNMVAAVATPLLTSLLLENEAAVHAGQMPTNIVNGSFFSCFITICGTGIALAITLAIFIAGKREDNRAIAKLSLFPNIFNINETIVFGLPIVLNPPMCVGFILAPLASYIISYVLTAIGFCPVMYINVPWTTPIVLSGFLASGGNIMGAVTQLICLAVAVLIYIPCIKAHEANQARTEAEAAE